MTLPAVGFLGPEGTFTAEAAHRAAPDHRRVPLPTIAEVFRAVRERSVDLGVVPIENLIEGSVNATLDELAFGPGGEYVRGELLVPVSLHLLARPGISMDQLVAVRSMPHALAQSREWLAANAPQAAQEAATSTAEAAREVAEESDRPVAAIGTLLAAERFGLAILARDVHEHDDNVTRFALLAPSMHAPTGADKTSLVVFFGEDRPGLLLRILDEFALRGINLTKIESRPAKTRMGEYGIFIDAEGHPAEPRLAEALRSVHRHVAELRVLGAFPRADLQPAHVEPRDAADAYAEAASWYAQLLARIDGAS